MCSPELTPLIEWRVVSSPGDSPANIDYMESSKFAIGKVLPLYLPDIPACFDWPLVLLHNARHCDRAMVSIARQTYYSPYNDMSMCSPELTSIIWRVVSSPGDSDHVPITMSCRAQQKEGTTEAGWNIRKAQWKAFTNSGV